MKLNEGILHTSSYALNSSTLLLLFLLYINFVWLVSKRKSQPRRERMKTRRRSRYPNSVMSIVLCLYVSASDHVVSTHEHTRHSHRTWVTRASIQNMTYYMFGRQAAPRQRRHSTDEYNGGVISHCIRCHSSRYMVHRVRTRFRLFVIIYIFKAVV